MNRSQGPHDMSAEDRSLLEQPLAAAAWKWLAQRYPAHGLTPDTSVQLDLGVDSLEWLGLAQALGEHTGAELDDAAIGRIETVRDLLGELMHAPGRTGGMADPLQDPERVLDAGLRRWLKPHGAGLRLLAGILYGINRGLLYGLFRLQVQDRQRVPMHRPLVVVCSHASYLDPFAVAAALPTARLHSLYWGGWTGAAFNNPFKRFISRATQVIPIDPRSGVRSSLALAAAVLQRRCGLIWFPEGRRSADGELQPLRPGIGMLLERFPVTLIPVVIHGAHAAMPPGRRFPRLRRIRVSFGEPLEPDRLAGPGEGNERSGRIVAALECCMRQLMAETRD